MIEQINGAGLSGIAGKSGKHGKNSLFAKLFAMLEKNAQVAGQGKSKLAHTKGMDKLITTAKAHHGNPLLAAKKGKHLLALATQQKHHKDGEDPSVAAVPTHIIFDSTTQIKKTMNTGNNKLLAAGQQHAAKGHQAGMAFEGSKQPLQTIQKVALNGESKSAIQTDTTTLSSTATSQEDTKAFAATATNQAVIKSNKNQASDLLKQAQQINPAAAQQVISAENNTPMQKKISTPSTESVARSLGQHRKGDISNTVTAPSQQLTGVQQQTGTQQSQAQQSSVTTAIAAASLAESSLTDSGSNSGSSDQGNQNTNNLSGLLADAKSSSSTSSTQANFHSYLTSKTTTPPMSIYDSMNHIAHAAKNGQTRLEIQLDPAHLGKIQISLQSDAATKQLQVHMIVDQGSTRAALEQQLPQLKTALTQQGFDLSGFSMGSQGQQQQSTGNHHHGHGQAVGTLGNASDQASEAPSINMNSSNLATDAGLSIRV